MLGSIFGLFLAGTANAQYIQSCADPSGNIITCKMGNTPGASMNLPPKPNAALPDFTVTGTALGALQNPNINGKYDTRYPGNIFAFCSGGRPSRGNPKRAIYNSICPAGKVSQ